MSLSSFHSTSAGSSTPQLTTATTDYPTSTPTIKGKRSYGNFHKHENELPEPIFTHHLDMENLFKGVPQAHAVDLNWFFVDKELFELATRARLHFRRTITYLTFPSLRYCTMP
jgi:hypothetical protein